MVARLSSGRTVRGRASTGCGAPLFAVSLHALARGFGAVNAAAPETPERQVADAMRAHPEMVGGTGRDDTRLMRAFPGLLVKGGAEGVHCAALPDGRCVAVKITDGGDRARMPVLVGGASCDGALPADEAAAVAAGRIGDRNGTRRGRTGRHRRGRARGVLTRRVGPIRTATATKPGGCGKHRDRGCTVDTTKHT